jgi:predicted site-specific integrase-resolvase
MAAGGGPAWPISLEAAAKLLGIHKTTLYHYIDQGDVAPAFKVRGDRKYWCFREADMLRASRVYERTLEWQRAHVPATYRRRMNKFRPWTG